MYRKPWVTSASAALAILASALGAYTGEISLPEAAAGVIAGGGMLGLGRKLEAIRQAAILAGRVAEEAGRNPPQ